MLLTSPPSRVATPALPPVDRTATILVTGATGLLGTALCAALSCEGHRVVAHGRTPRDGGLHAFPLEEAGRAEALVRQVRPDWILHSAGNTNLDACELDPASAHRLHVTASAELARAARAQGARLLYVSTDSVYDGDQPGAHAEDDPLRPVNHYARTKRAGELACLDVLPDAIIARVNFFGLHPTRPQGLVAWLLASLRAGRGVNGFTDVRFNPLLNHDLAALLAGIVQGELPGGIYNLGAADACSKHEFACRVARRLGQTSGQVHPALLAASGLPTPRPRNTVMDTRKITAALGRRLPTIDEGLDRLFATLAT